jgi:hypothetical protein
MKGRVKARARAMTVSSAAAERARAAREVRHRLAPGRALQDLEDAADFLEEMGLLLQTPHPYLPSLFGAAQGKPAKPGAAGFGQWPEHAWSFAGELAQRKDVLLTKVVLGRRTLVHERLWKPLDAAVRGREVQGDDELDIVKALKGPKSLRTDELRILAGFDGPAGRKRYQKAIERLESMGIVLATPALVDNHRHVAIAELWERRFPKALSKSRGVGELVTATIRASGPVPAAEVEKWFARPPAETASAVDQLLSAGELRLSDGLLGRH